MTFDFGVAKRQRTRQIQVFGGTTTKIGPGPGDFRVHTFTTSGTLRCWNTVEVELLLVAGGGAGAQFGAGGGAGGVILRTATLTPGTYTITIGAGGITGIFSTSGSDSSITGSEFQLVALGGGGASGNPTQSGGSGAGSIGPDYGGSRPRGGTPGLGLQPGSSWGGLGNNGGAYGGNRANGGGGGAGGPGLQGWGTADSSACIGGDGGPGIASDISGTTQYYAGGGAGQAYIYSQGSNGPLHGYRPVSPIPLGYENIFDTVWINDRAIANAYSDDPFSVTINLPFSGVYRVKWFIGGLTSFNWNMDGGQNYNQNYGAVNLNVRYLTIYADAGEHVFNFALNSSSNSHNAGWARLTGFFAWSISNEAGTVEYWNTRNYGVLTGGPDHYGGGGGSGQNGGPGIAILRYRNI